jgi:uncharacterized protein YqcC (DUF446 family)
MEKNLAIQSLLMDIQAQMHALNLWESEPPSEQALASTEPFCIDTLSFSQWLQFVFIARLRYMIDAELALPSQSDVTAMAEEYFRPLPINANTLIHLIQQIDNLLGQPVD